jgi:hypothetical protein
VTVVALVGDLITASRIASVAELHHVPFRRIDSPDQLPPDDDVLLVVDWGERDARLGQSLREWIAARPASRCLLFGPHVDRQAHADARGLGLGPVVARSALIQKLNRLVSSHP